MAQHNYNSENAANILSEIQSSKALIENSPLTIQHMPFSWNTGIINTVVQWVEVLSVIKKYDRLYNLFCDGSQDFISTANSISELDSNEKEKLVSVLSSLQETVSAVQQSNEMLQNFSQVTEVHTWLSEREAVIYDNDYIVGYNPKTDTYEYNWGKIASLFFGRINPNELSDVALQVKNKSKTRADSLTETDYKDLCYILNTFVRQDGSIDEAQLQKFLELGCTDGILMTAEGVSDYPTDCGSVLRELSKYAKKENSVISIGLESMPESKSKIPKSIMLVNNIVIATAAAKPTPQGRYYNLRPAPKPIVIQQPYNPVGAVVNPSSTNPLVVGYEQPEYSFEPQKRINITLKKSTIADGDVSVWSVGDFATVYEYSGNATDVLKDVRNKYINYAEQKANDRVDTLKVSVPKSGLDFTDTGTFLDGTGMVLDVIGCIPVAAEISNWVETGLNITSLTVDTVSLINDSNPQTKAAYEQHKQVESIKSDISIIFDNLSKKLDEIDKKSAKLEYSGAYFSAIYYNKTGSVSLSDYNISKDDLIRYVRVYNEKAVAKNSNITDESLKLPVFDEQKIASGDLSELEQYNSIYLDTLSKGDLLDM